MSGLLPLARERRQARCPVTGRWASPQGTVLGRESPGTRQQDFLDAHSSHRRREQGSAKSIRWESCLCLSGDPATQSTCHSPGAGAVMSVFPWGSPWLLCKRWVAMPTPDWWLGPPHVCYGLPIFPAEGSQFNWTPAHSLCCQWSEEDIQISKTRSSLNAGDFSFASVKTFPDLLGILNVHFHNGDTC